jgi:hypothetical protein
MASNINYASIDETYPIAGKDNDSQGFRDNFGFIKNSLTSAKSEIENLQNNTVKLNEDNSFSFENTISKAQLKNWGETLHDGGTIGTDTLVSYTDGSVQLFKIAGDLNLSLDGFPPINIVGKLRIHLTNDTTVPHTVTFDVQGGTIKTNIMFNGYTGSTAARTSNPITLSSESNPVVIDFWTYDFGSTVFMNYVGQFV